MERKQKERNIKKFVNRTFSYFVLLFSVFALCYSFKLVVSYVQVKKENSVLNDTLKELKESNEHLENLNNKLKDNNYFSVYVKDKYQYSSNNDSIIPID